MSRFRLFLVSTLIALLALGLAEGLLRLAGFRHEAAPVVLRFGYPNPREITGLFRPDSRLFWRLKPGGIFDSESPVPINEDGYRGPLPGEAGGEDLLRIAVLGDSVSFGAETAWPEILQDRLRRTVEVLNFSVPGYSSVQGLRQFEDEVAGLRPDVVVIAFGWNDHWLARGGLPDHQRRLPPRWLASTSAWLSRLRIAQAAAAVRAKLAGEPGSSENVPRVPPDRFREQIGSLIDGAMESGAEAVVLTLPSGLAEGRVPSYLVEMGFTPEEDRAILDHFHYTEMAREMARGKKAALVDLDRIFRDERGEPLPGLFRQDRIHLTAEGQLRAADAVEEALVPLLPGEGGR